MDDYAETVDYAIAQNKFVEAFVAAELLPESTGTYTGDAKVYEKLFPGVHAAFVAAQVKKRLRIK